MDVLFNSLNVCQVEHVLEDCVAHMHGEELRKEHTLLLVEPHLFNFNSRQIPWVDLKDILQVAPEYLVKSFGDWFWRYILSLGEGDGEESKSSVCRVNDGSRGCCQLQFRGSRGVG